MYLDQASGIVRNADLLESQQRLFAEPLFMGRYARLVDASAVTEFHVTALTVRYLARFAVHHGMRRAALVAGSDVVYGLMRMYESYAAGADIYVCRSRAEAIAWLGGLHPQDPRV